MAGFQTDPSATSRKLWVDALEHKLPWEATAKLIFVVHVYKCVHVCMCMCVCVCVCVCVCAHVHRHVQAWVYQETVFQGKGKTWAFG